MGSAPKFRLRWIPVLTTALCGLGSMLWFGLPPTEFVSKVGLVLASGQIVIVQSSTAENDKYKMMFLADFPQSIIEVLESEEMMKRAVKRLGSEGERNDVRIEASTGRSAIIQVRAYGRDPERTRLVLDALITEYSALREVIRLQKRSGTFTSLLDDINKCQEQLKEASTRVFEFEKLHPIKLLKSEATRIEKSLSRLRTEQELTNQSSGNAQSNGTIGDHLKRLSAQINALMQDQAKNHFLLTEHEERQAERDINQCHFDEVIDLFRKLSISEDMIGDSVTPLDKASAAIPDTNERSQKVLNSSIHGFVLGFILLMVVSSARWLMSLFKTFTARSSLS